MTKRKKKPSPRASPRASPSGAQDEDDTPYGQAVDLLEYIATTSATFYTGLGDVIRRFEDTGELPSFEELQKAVAQKAKGKRKAPQGKAAVKGKKRAITYFNLFVKDRVAEITAEFEERRLQQEADVKAGKLAAVTMKNKPNDTFKRAVGAWSALSKVEKETYKVERMALMAQEKAAEELAAEAAKAAAGAEQQAAGDAQTDTAAPGSPSSQAAAADSRSSGAEPAPVKQKASKPVPKEPALPAAAPAASAQVAEASQADGEKKKKKKKKRKAEQLEVASSSQPAAAAPAPAAAEPEKKKKKKKRVPLEQSEAE